MSEVKPATDEEIAENKFRHQCDEVAHNSFACHYQDSLLARIESDRVIIGDLLAQLHSVEWINSEIFGKKWCPSCGHGELRGHAINCELSTAIAKARAEGK